MRHAWTKDERKQVIALWQTKPDWTLAAFAAELRRHGIDRSPPAVWFAIRNYITDGLLPGDAGMLNRESNRWGRTLHPKNGVNGHHPPTPTPTAAPAPKTEPPVPPIDDEAAILAAYSKGEINLATALAFLRIARRKP